MAAAFAGLTFGLSEAMLERIAHMTILHAIVWFPLMLLAIDRLRGPRPTLWMAIGAFAIAAVVFISYAIAAYRGVLVSRTVAYDAPIDKVLALQFDAMGTALSVVMQGGQVGRGFYKHYDASHILQRFNHVSSFALVLEFHNGIPPYENTYASLIVPVFAVDALQSVVWTVLFLSTMFASSFFLHFTLVFPEPWPSASSTKIKRLLYGERTFCPRPVPTRSALQT